MREEEIIIIKKREEGLKWKEGTGVYFTPLCLLKIKE